MHVYIHIYIYTHMETCAYMYDICMCISTFLVTFLDTVDDIDPAFRTRKNGP